MLCRRDLIFQIIALSFNKGLCTAQAESFNSSFSEDWLSGGFKMEIRSMPGSPQRLKFDGGFSLMSMFNSKQAFLSLALFILSVTLMVLD